MKSKLMKIILYIIIIFQINILSLNSKEDDDFYNKIDLFNEVLKKIEKEYIDEVNKSQLMEAAINGILQSLDPYSAYMDSNYVKKMQTDTKGEFGGLGIEVTMEAGVVKVISPIDNTPAAKVGIKAGDYIVRIDGEQVQGKTLLEAVDLMRGKVNTSIKLTVRRKGSKKPIEFTVERKIIKVKSASSKIIDEKIAYLRIKAFNENTDLEVKKQISNFQKNKNITSYILDLRNNPGGLLSQAINITDIFLNDGEIVSTRGRRAKENRKFFAKKGDKTNGKNLIILINYGSASASEIVAGALQDHKRAILLGETTFGKGSVQSIIKLSSGGGIRLTISKYYLPSGKSISEIGVVPDIKIEENENDFKINTASDNQLNYAIKLLTG